MIAKLIAVAILATVSLPIFADSGADESKPADSTALTKYRCYTQDVVMPLWYAR